MTGGYGSEQLFNKEVTDTGKVDKNGTPIKTTKFVPILRPLFLRRRLVIVLVRGCVWSLRSFNLLTIKT